MEYFEYNSKQLVNNPKIDVVILDNDEEVFKKMAEEMVDTIVENNQLGENTVFIVPVGPVGHYKYFVDIVNEKNINLKDTWFINMDEYLVDGEWISEDNHLSFRKFMNEEVYNKINPNLNIPVAQRVFPNPKDLKAIENVLSKLKKIDIAFGGIGINGHIAFNEPDANLSIEEYLKLPTRIQEIALETRVVNSIASLNGAFEMMPTCCVTIGMDEIFSAKKIRLGVFREWHRAVIRKAVHSEPTTEFPVTLLQNHKDVQIYCTKFVAQLSE